MAETPDRPDVPPRVSQAYRNLGAEEPPRALDEAIRAAARRPARGWTQRWALPLSLAAVVVLSVTITLRVQDEQPGIERPVPATKEAPQPPAPAPQAKADAAKEALLRLKAEAEIKSAVRAERGATPFPGGLQDQAAAVGALSAPAPAAGAAPAPPAPVPLEMPSLRREEAHGPEAGVASPVSREADERAARDAEAAARAPQLGAVRALAKQAQSAAAGKTQAETPEQELERIARLRREGRHEEADKALAEFRKRFPDYRIPEPMLQRVERR